jgi:hypothetical protein
MMKQAFGFGRGHAYLFRRHGAGLRIDFPGNNLDWRTSPVRAWLDLASADKKMLMILVGAIVYPPLLALLPVYAVYLLLSARRRARQAGISVSIWTAARLALLLVLKSASLTVGRWWGSVVYRTACF